MAARILPLRVAQTPVPRRVSHEEEQSGRGPMNERSAVRLPLGQLLKRGPVVAAAVHNCQPSTFRIAVPQYEGKSLRHLLLDVVVELQFLL